MGQVRHGSATTTYAVRAAIQRSQASITELSQELGINPKTVAKWRKRPRRPMVGMMLHQDGSSHEWVPDQWWDLIVTMDDANSKVYSAFFVAEEGTMSSFMALTEVIEAHGLFCSLYTDRGSHYWHTPESRRQSG